MKIVPLQKVVNEFKPETIRVKGEDAFFVKSAEYEEKKEWFIKGDFVVVPNGLILGLELKCDRLEKDITVTLNHPTINADTVKSTDEPIPPTPEEILKIEADKIFHVRLLHAPTGKATNTLAIKRSDIPRFIEGSLSKFESDQNKKNFFVIRISFEDKTIDCDRIE